jgi:hypothetical protein
MKNKAFLLTGLMATIAVAMLGIGIRDADNNGSKGTSRGIPPETVASYLHAVIQADRRTYTTHVVERMQLRGTVVASEDWEQRGTLPLPVQFLNESARLVAQEYKGVAFRLASLSPINDRNAPTTEFERAGLMAVQTQVDHPYTGIITKGGQRYFQAIYADRAVSQSCIGCHNVHPKSPKRNFALNDVMGGLVITIPIGS